MTAGRLRSVDRVRRWRVVVAAVVALAAGACGDDDDGGGAATTTVAPLPSVPSLDIGLRQVLQLYSASASEPLTNEEIECAVAALDESITVDQLNGILRGEQDPAVGELFTGALKGCGVPVGT